MFHFCIIHSCTELPESWMQALAELEYPGKLQRLLLTPEREVLVELVITKDNGEIETFNAYRVQHSNSRGPYKGGLRYHPQVDLDDVRRRAHVLQHQHTRTLSAASPRADHASCCGRVVSWRFIHLCTQLMPG